jgi:hypothetical protein
MTETDADFLLRCLSDGQPHTLNELLARSFAERGCGLTVHSRAADLRKRGHTIINKFGGMRNRRPVSVYQLEPCDHHPTAEEAFGPGERRGNGMRPW